MTKIPTENDVQQRDDFHREVKRVVGEYLKLFPEEKARLEELMKQLSNDELDLRHRDTIPEGHMCASGILVSEDGTRVLMQGHKTLGIPVVPGGHYDDTDINLSETALREAREETGIEGLRLHPWHEQHGGIPFDIDIHPIPENTKKGEGVHQHFDFRYLVLADSGYDAAYAYAKANFDPLEVTDIFSMKISEVPSDLSISPALAKLNDPERIDL